MRINTFSKLNSIKTSALHLTQNFCENVLPKQSNYQLAFAGVPSRVSENSGQTQQTHRNNKNNLWIPFFRASRGEELLRARQIAAPESKTSTSNTQTELDMAKCLNNRTKPLTSSQSTSQKEAEKPKETLSTAKAARIAAAQVRENLKQKGKL